MLNNDNTSISVIIPNFNGRNLLEKNIPSLLSALGNINYEIIVVDDCSTDDSVTFMEQFYPNIIIVKNRKNLGFSATCNKGIFTAKKLLLCLTSTDVTFTKEFFNNAFPYFKNPNVFAVKGEIINYAGNQSNILNKETTSMLYYKRGFLRFNQRVTPDTKNFTGQINGQFVLLGCCFVCTREIMLELNGYNEIFSPFYWEDADIAIRALRKNYKLIYAPECKVFHETSSTISKHIKNTKRRLVSNRNKFIFTWKHLNNFKYWCSHIFFTFINIFTRWIILDWKYYVSLILAVDRIFKYKTNEK